MRTKEKPCYDPIIPPEVIADIQCFRDKLYRLPPEYRMYLNGMAAGLLMAENIADMNGKNSENERG